MALSLFMNDGSIEQLFGSNDTRIAQEFRQILETRLGTDAAKLFEQLVIDNTCENLFRQLNNANGEVVQKDDEIEDLREEIEDLEGRIDRANAEIHEKDDEIRRLKYKIQELEDLE